MGMYAHPYYRINMTKKRRSILIICVAAIIVAVLLPWQWTVAESTDSAGWKLTVRKIPFHKLDYITCCILDLSISPVLHDYYYKCLLSRRGRTVSSRTFAWPSYHPRNIRIEFQSALPNGNRTAVIEFSEVIVRCSWSHDQTIWKEVDTYYEGGNRGMSLINPKKLEKNRDSGAADKAAIQRVRVPPCQLPDSGT